MSDNTPRPLPATIRPAALLRFWRRVDRRSDGCWIWTGGITERGYGQVCIDYTAYQTGRIAYYLVTGQDPGTKKLQHTCRNKLCVNPDHMEFVEPHPRIYKPRMGPPKPPYLKERLAMDAKILPLNHLPQETVARLLGISQSTVSMSRKRNGVHVDHRTRA